MAEFFHGVHTRQIATNISTPTVAGSGITFAVGTAPIHTANKDNVNTIISGNDWTEAVSALGYSDNWAKYSLCEVMYCHYKLYATAPVIFVNVLNPTKHKKTNAAKDYVIVDRKITLPYEAIKTTVKASTYIEDKDFVLFYDNNALILEILEDGLIPAATTSLSITFDEIDPSMVDEKDIIGGIDTTTKKLTGLELIDNVFPKLRIVPDIIICPGWSQKVNVAAIMGVKAQSINGLFEAKAICDVDTSTVKDYSGAATWKSTNNINQKTQILCFPMCRLGDKVFYKSTHAAALMAVVDTDNGGNPSESPSNKTLRIDADILADKTEVLLDLQQANSLNANGIVTALNFTNGFVLWGNFTACYPYNKDVKDYMISVSRMFGWVSKSIILTNWSKVDAKMNRRFIESIVDAFNIWMNGLTNDGHLLGGHVEFREDDNSPEDFMSGKALFRVFLTPPSPAQELEYVLAYSTEYAAAALS